MRLSMIMLLRRLVLFGVAVSSILFLLLYSHESTILATKFVRRSTNSDILQLIANSSAICTDRALINCIIENGDCQRLLTIGGSDIHFLVMSDRWSNLQLSIIQRQSLLSDFQIEWFHDYYITLHGNNRTFFLVKTENSSNDDFILHREYANQPARAIIKFQSISAPLIVADSNQTILVTLPADVDTFFWQWQRARYLTCNLTLQLQLNEFYQSNNISVAILATDSSVADMVLLRDLLIKLRITPMLFGGTLLGWYRECGIIPHTIDIDFAAFAHEYDPILLTKLNKSSRFKLKQILGRPSDSLELKINASDKVAIDLFFIYRNVSVMNTTTTWISGLDTRTREKIRWIYSEIGDVCSTQFYHRLMYVPCNVDEVLIADYGRNWSIPHLTKNFDWRTSLHNSRHDGYWSIEEWPNVFREL